MSETKFTPGPWIVNGRAIEQDIGKRKALVIAYVEDRQNDAWEANATAIAALPDAFAALKMLADHPCAHAPTCGHAKFSECRNALVSAIHKQCNIVLEKAVAP